MANTSKSDVKHAHLDVMSTALQFMRKADLYTDARIMCQGRTYPVHRAVLHAGSVYFATMFQTDMKEAATCEVKLEEIDCKTLELILYFMYTGDVECIDEDEETVRSVLAASHLLQMDSLYEYCWSKLLIDLNPTHYFDIWGLADLYGNQEVLERITDLLAINYSEATKSKDFFLINASQFNNILKSLKLIESAEIIIKDILQWVRYLEDERIVNLPMLMGSVILGKVSNGYLTQLTRDPLIKKCTKLYELCVSLSLSRLELNRLLSGPKIVGFTSNNKVTTYSFVDSKWDEEKELPFMLLEGMTAKEVGDCIYFVGGEMSTYVYHYLPAANSVQASGQLEIHVKKIEIGVLRGCLIIFGIEDGKTNQITVQKYHLGSRKSVRVGSIDLECDAYYVQNLADNLYVIVKRGSLTSIISWTKTFNYSTIVMPTIADKWNDLDADYNQHLYVYTGNSMRRYDLGYNTWAERPIDSHCDSELRQIWVSGKEKALSFLVLWSLEMRKFLIYRVDKHSFDIVHWPSIAEGTFCNCVVMY